MPETLPRRAVPPARNANASAGPRALPAGTTLLLAIGTLLASRMDTTGAAMVLIHPLLRANAPRRRKVHQAGRIIASPAPACLG